MYQAVHLFALSSLRPRVYEGCAFHRGQLRLRDFEPQITLYYIYIEKIWPRDSTDLNNETLSIVKCLAARMNTKGYLTIRPQGRMDYESIDHEAVGRMDYLDSLSMRPRGLIVLV